MNRQATEMAKIFCTNGEAYYGPEYSRHTKVVAGAIEPWLETTTQNGWVFTPSNMQYFTYCCQGEQNIPETLMEAAIESLVLTLDGVLA